MRDCSHEVRCATYTALVRPTLEYASTVWDPHKKQDVDLLETVQRKAARYACNCYLERSPGTVTALLERLQWESLEKRRSLSRLGMLYKIENGLVDVQPANLYRPSYSRMSDRNTRIYQEHTAHSALHYSFVPRTVREWNRLPHDVTTAPSLEKFFSRLRCSPSSLQLHKADNKILVTKHKL